MDLQYGIAVTNKFALFIDEDEDPLEILRQKEEESKNAPATKKDKKKTSAKKSATENKPKQQEQPLKREDAGQLRQGSASRGGRGGRGRELRENDGSRPPRRQGPRDNRDFRGDENVPPEFRDRGDAGNRDRDGNSGGFERGRGGRGSGRGGRGRGGRGGPRPEGGRGNFGGPFGERRREFDRHSGTDRTGVKPTEKRDGSGAHNWGSYRDDVEDQGQNQNPADVSGEWPQPSAEQPDNEQKETEEGASPKEDEEPKEMTLDEWKALQDQKRMKAQFNIRRAGEGVDSNQWKKGVAYKKKPLQEEEEEEESEEEEEDDDRHGHRKQLVTDIRITFADNPRRGGRGGRGGRGSRGGPRGGRGGERGDRGGDRGDRGDRPYRGGPRETAPRVDDETDFPALVKSEA